MKNCLFTHTYTPPLKLNWYCWDRSALGSRLAVFAARLLLHVPHFWWHARQSRELAGHVDYVEKPGSTAESRRQVVPEPLDAQKLERVPA